MSSPTLPSHLPCPINSLPLSSFNLCLHNVAPYRPSAFSKFLPRCSPVILFTGNLLRVYFPSLSHQKFFLVAFALFFSCGLFVVSHLTANVMLIQAVETRIDRKSFLLSPQRLHVWKFHYIINTPLRGLVWSWQHEYLFSPWNNTVSMLCPLKQDGFPSSASQEAGRDFFFLITHFVSLMTYFFHCILHTLFSFHYLYISNLVSHLLIEGFEKLFFLANNLKPHI